MEFVEKNINEQLNKELEATEGRLTHIKKAIYGDKTGKIKTFAIISPDNPMGESARPEENNVSRKRMKNYLGKGFGKDKFKSTLDVGRYQYILQEGKFGNKEQSFFIFNISLNSAKSLSTHFSQESFIFGEQTSSGVKVYYYETSKDEYEKTGKIDYKLITSSSGVNLLDTASDFYSKVKGFKYSFDFAFETIPSSDLEALESSVDDRYTGKSQYYSRIKSQR